MDTLQAIKTRRSIRRYTSEHVSNAAVEDLLRAAMAAPSAFDERPWEFVVIEDRSVLAALADSMEHCEMLREATLGILICADEAREKLKGFWIQDCSACAENVLLAAHALGLGAVWVGIHPVGDRLAAVSSALGVPAAIIPFALIAIGHPAETLPAEDRFDQSRVHRNRW